MICQLCKQPSDVDDIEQTKKLLAEDLYHISPLSRAINKDILSLAYTPGVAEVCMEIKENPASSDQLTFRSRAVAVVSDGSMLDSEGRRFMPVMDWFIAQLKFYAGVDAFPFVIRKETNLEDLFRDLSTSYGNILYLDKK
jgi:malate dehydrogenase (oxaloacetate-decarboxylating)